ncbi:MAG: hypothetical protein U0270_41610 [Labilithrix sp.]
MDDVRSRIRSHLTALSAASVIVACNHRACGKTDGGYGVVDPLPPPSCVDKGQPTATASFVMVTDPDAGAAKARAVRMTIRVDIEGTEYNGATTVSGRILEQKTTTEGLELVVLPAPAATALDVSVAVSCNVGSSSFHVRLALEQDGGDGGPPVPQITRW